MRGFWCSEKTDQTLGLAPTALRRDQPVEVAAGLEDAGVDVDVNFVVGAAELVDAVLLEFEQCLVFLKRLVNLPVKFFVDVGTAVDARAQRL